MPFSGTGAAAGASAGSAVGPWGTAIGAILGGFLGSGKKPAKSAPFTPINLQDEQANALKGNLANENDIETLLSKSNAFNQDQAISLLEKAMPGYGKLSSKLTDTASGLLDHPYDLPKDVQANLSRIAAEKGISRGTSGQFNDFSLLRDLGVNSLDYGASRINQAQGITGLLSSIAPKVNPMSPISFYVSPAQQAQNAQFNAQGRQDTAQAGNNAAAAAANANQQATWQNLGSILQSVGGKVSNKNPLTVNPFGVTEGANNF